MTVDFPPLFMASRHGEGVGDQAQRAVMAHLEAYEHVLEAVPPNYQRIEQELKNHADVCFAGFLKTPARERFMVFSEPYLLMLPVQLYVPAQRPQPPSGPGGQVDLQAILAQGGFRLGVLGGRRYEPAVDTLIDAYADTPAVYRRYSKDQLAGLINMMTSHEHGVDGVLASPSEINYLHAGSHGGAVDLRGYPLKGMPPFVLGYFACSASDRGREVIQRIDHAIPALRAQAAQRYARDLPADLRAIYDQLLRRQWGFALAPE
jgi:uncharacterized protein (TIGR02285 family)